MFNATCIINKKIISYKINAHYLDSNQGFYLKKIIEKKAECVKFYEFFVVEKIISTPSRFQ